MNEFVLGASLACVFANFILLALNLKLFTEFAKEKFKGRD